jgi:hypothetical protein
LMLHRRKAAARQGQCTGRHHQSAGMLCCDGNMVAAAQCPSESTCVRSHHSTAKHTIPQNSAASLCSTPWLLTVPWCRQTSGSIHTSRPLDKASGHSRSFDALDCLWVYLLWCDCLHCCIYHGLELGQAVIQVLTAAANSAAQRDRCEVTD